MGRRILDERRTCGLVELNSAGSAWVPLRWILDSISVQAASLLIWNMNQKEVPEFSQWSNRVFQDANLVLVISRHRWSSSITTVSERFLKPWEEEVRNIESTGKYSNGWFLILASHLPVSVWIFGFDPKNGMKSPLRENRTAGSVRGVVCLRSHGDDIVTLPEETGSNREYKLSPKALQAYFYSTIIILRLKIDKQGERGGCFSIRGVRRLQFLRPAIGFRLSAMGRGTDC